MWAACRLLSSTTTIAIYYYYSAQKLILIYLPTEGRRLSWLRHCRKGAHSLCPKVVNHSGFYNKHNCRQRNSIPGPCALQSGMLPLDHCNLALASLSRPCGKHALYIDHGCTLLLHRHTGAGGNVFLLYQHPNPNHSLNPKDQSTPSLHQVWSS